jgi:hypothetical protein
MDELPRTSGVATGNCNERGYCYSGIYDQFGLLQTSITIASVLFATAPSGRYMGFLVMICRDYDRFVPSPSVAILFVTICCCDGPKTVSQ